MNDLILFVITIVSWAFIFLILRSDKKEQGDEGVPVSTDQPAGKLSDHLDGGLVDDRGEYVVGLRYARIVTYPRFVTAWSSYGQGEREGGAGDELPRSDRTDGE